MMSITPLQGLLWKIGVGIYWIGDKIAHIGLALRRRSTEQILKKTLVSRDERLTDRPLIDESGEFVLTPRYFLPKEGPDCSYVIQKGDDQFQLPLTKETTRGDLESFRNILVQHGCILNGLQPSVNVIDNRRLINQLWYFENTKELVDIVLLMYDQQSGDASRLVFSIDQQKPPAKMQLHLYPKRPISERLSQ